jgi:anti-sigma regulatory factor (Ser/Thr protein kinase)
MRRIETGAKEVLVNATSHERLNLSHEECVLLAELLETTGTKLLVEIRRTDHRVYRDELRHRLTMVESLRERLSKPALPMEGDE